MVVDYPGQSIGGAPAPNNNISMNNDWLPDILNGVHKRQLAATKSDRWLTKLSIIEDDFYGDIVQQYSASFPRAFRYDAKEKPDFMSNWGVNTSVRTTQVNWQRVYGIDIDTSELQEIMDDEEQYQEFIANNFQEGINAANLEELSLITYGLEQMLDDVTNLDQETCFQELLAEVDSHLGYVINESFMSADDEVIILTDFSTAARLKALPSLRYVDRQSRERVLNKIVPIPFIPEVYETINPIVVEQGMVDGNSVLENYKVGDTMPIGSLILDVSQFNMSDLKPVLLDQNGNRPNIIVYDKRSIFVGKRPTLFNWTNIDGDINFNHQKMQRGLLSQNTLERSMNVAFCDLFKIRAFRYDYN